MAQVVEQVRHPAHQALPAGIEQFLDRQRIEQRVARCQGVVDLVEQEMCTGPVIVVQVAFIYPQAGLLLPGQIGLQATAVKRVLAPCRIAEARVPRAWRIGRVAEHHATQLAAQGEQVACGMQRVEQTMATNIAQRGNQVAAAQADDRVLCVHAHGGERCRPFGRFVFHGSTPSSGHGRDRTTANSTLAAGGRAGVHDRALTFLLEELHDDRGDGFGPGDQEQMTVVDNM
ncbi:hypothetical protein D3C81_1121810 [compost metagenome]